MTLTLQPVRVATGFGEEGMLVLDEKQWLVAVLEHRTFRWTHHQQPRDGPRIAKMQNSLDPTSRPML